MNSHVAVGVKKKNKKKGIKLTGSLHNLFGNIVKNNFIFSARSAARSLFDVSGSDWSELLGVPYVPENEHGFGHRDVLVITFRTK